MNAHTVHFDFTDTAEALAISAICDRELESTRWSTDLRHQLHDIQHSALGVVDGLNDASEMQRMLTEWADEVDYTTFLRVPSDGTLAHFKVTPGGCWEWSGLRYRATGYGRVKQSTAHRVFYEAFNGPVPAGLVVCHKCDNRLCVNPEHLFVGSQGDNVRDARDKGRLHAQSVTHCPQGHEYTPENTYLFRTSRGCRECQRRHKREYMRRKRAALRAERNVSTRIDDPELLRLAKGHRAFLRGGL